MDLLPRLPVLGVVARCFVMRFILGLDEAAAFFGGSVTRDPNAFRSRTDEIPCQDKGMPLRAARGYRKLGAIGCRGASWSKELDGKDSAERIPVFWETPSVLHCGMLNL